MDNQGKEKGRQKETGPGTEKEKDWENPMNPEGTEDQRDVEQVERQMEEAKRRKENLNNGEN